MYSMHEALAREHQRELQRQAHHARLVRRAASERRHRSPLRRRRTTQR